MARFANLSVGLSVESTQYRQGLNRAQTTTRTFGQRLSATLQSTTGRFFNLQRIVTASAAAIGAAVTAYTAAALRSNDEIAKQARNIGFSTQEFQRYSVGLQQADVSQGGFVKSVQQITRTIGDAERGLESSIQAYEQLGLNYMELAELAPEEQFREVVNALTAAESPTTRASAGAVILGREWRNLGTVIDQGLDTLLATTDNITQASDEAIMAAESINDNWLRINETFRNEIGNVTLPILDRFVNRLGDITNTRPYENIRDLIDEIGEGISSFDLRSNVTGNLYDDVVELTSGVDNLNDRLALYRQTLEALRVTTNANSVSNQLLRADVERLIAETEAAVTVSEEKTAADQEAADAEIALAMTREMLTESTSALIDQGDAFAAAQRQARMDIRDLITAERLGIISKDQLNVAIDGVQASLRALNPTIIENTRNEAAAKVVADALADSIRSLVDRGDAFAAAQRQAVVDQTNLNQAFEDGVITADELAVGLAGIEENLIRVNPQTAITARETAAAATAAENLSMMIRSLVDQGDVYAAAQRRAIIDQDLLNTAYMNGAITADELAIANQGITASLLAINPAERERIRLAMEAEVASRDLVNATNSIIDGLHPFTGATRIAMMSIATLGEAFSAGLIDATEYGNGVLLLNANLLKLDPTVMANAMATEVASNALTRLAERYSGLTSEQFAYQEATELLTEAERLKLTVTDEQIAAYDRLGEAAELSAQRQAQAILDTQLQAMASSVSYTALQNAQSAYYSNVAQGIAGLAEAVGEGSEAAFLIGKAAAVAQVLISDAQARAAFALVAANQASLAGPAAVGVFAATLASLNAQQTVLTAISLATIAAQTIQGLQTGGTVTQGGIFTVGERGPENVFLPGNAQVAATGSALGPNSGSTTIGDVTIVNQVGPNVSPRQVGDSTGRRFIDFVNNGALDSGSNSVARQRTAI